MIKRHYCILALLIVVLPLTARVYTNVTRTYSAANTKHAVTYCLPKTRINVEVKATRTIEKPGPFFNYAQRYLNTKNLIIKASDTWKVASIHIQESSVANPDQMFAIAINSNTTASNITLNNKGVLLGVNCHSPIKNTTDSESIKLIKETVSPINFDRSVLGEDALIANSIPKMAEMAARQIYRIRESRTNLLTGDVEHMPDGTALKTMLHNLDHQEAELLSLFEGKRIQSTVYKTYTLNPHADIENKVLFRISTLTGLTSADDLLGSPFYVNLKGNYIPKEEVNTTEVKKVAQDGIFYCIPGSATLTISNRKEWTVQQSICMPQFGIVKSLPAFIFDTKYGITRILLDPQSGRLIHTTTQK